jgi:hypothetical protein
MEFQSESNDTFNPLKWDNAPTLRNLKQELEDANSAHDAQNIKINRWLDNLHVRNDAVPDSVEGHSRFQPKLIRKQAEWRYAALSEPFHSSNNIFSVKPRTFEDVEGARQNSMLLNYQFGCKIDKVRFIDEYVRAAVDEGTAIVKVAWEFEETEVKEQQTIYEYAVNEQLGPLHEELHALMESDPRGYKEQVPEELRMAHKKTMEEGQPFEATAVDVEEVSILKTVKNQPALEVCDYKNVIIDPSCGSEVDKANFIIYRFETSLSNLERAGIYTNLEQINVEANSPLNEPDQSGLSADENFNFNDKPRKRLVAHEYWGYWDIDDTGIVKPIVATWVGDTLIRMDASPAPDGKLPFVVVPTLPVKNSVYGEPDGELLIDNQKVIGAVTRGMIDIMGKSANGQMGMQKGALDAVNRRRFQRGLDYEYNAGTDPRLSFYMHTYPEIPQSAQYMLQMQNYEAESMSGVKAFSQGINGGSLGDVATAVTGALDAASKREMGILRRIATGMEKIGRKIMEYNAELLDDEEVIRVTNDNFVAINRDSLMGDYDMIIDISTAEEDNVKAQELAFMLQTMGNSLDPAMTKMLLRDIARLRKMPELAESIENYEPQPDPMQQQIAQLEMAKLQAEIQKIESESAENYATARKKTAEADGQDLNFVEQESGVTQEREKELRGEQAQSNMALESHKAALNQQSELSQYLNQN